VASLKKPLMSEALLLDAGFSARPLKLSLEAAGYCVHTVGARATDALALENPNHHLVDYSCLEALSKVINHVKPAQILPGCTDVSYEMCCELTAKGVITGFEGIDTLRQLQDKAAFRDLCQRCNVPAPRKFNSVEDALSGACPMVIKPSDAFSGKGITVLQKPSKTKIESAISLARSVSRSKTVVLEEFISGQLFSFSAFLSKGKVARSFSVIEFGFVNPLVVDTSYVVEMGEVEGLLSTYTELLCADLGLTEGLFHIQYILAEEGPFLIEVTRRCPGDLYCELIRRATGFDYAAGFVSAFLTGSQFSSQKSNHVQGYQYTVRHTVTGQKAGNLTSLGFNYSAAPAAWYPLAVSGATMAPSPAGRVGVAFYQVKSERARNELVELIANDQLVSIGYSG
jgi:predicted ATP-grasp superfamily ATP-dependent carboligase